MLALPEDKRAEAVMDVARRLAITVTGMVR